MTSILILESNPPEILSQGLVASTSFVNTLLGVSQELQLRIVSPYNHTVNADLFVDTDGVIFSGSYSQWAADAPEVAPLRQAMRMAFDTGIPAWGSCNGLQLATVVLGGEVAESPDGIEIGLAQNLELTRAGASHPMMAGRASGFAVPCIHRDHVTKPPQDAVVLASNQHSAVQAFAYNQNGIDFWGTQYHPELSPRDIAQAIRGDGLFGGQSQAANDLDLAEVDERAALRLGTTTADQQPQTRACELFNWMDHVNSRCISDS